MELNSFGIENMPEPPSMTEEETVNRSPNAGNNSAAEQGVEIPKGWKPTIDAPIPVVRCRATSTTSGERCKRWSIRGTTVCASHGGRLPNVIEHSAASVESARLDLMGLAGDAVEVIKEFLLNPATTEATRLKAAENVLNRTGIKEALEMKIEVENKVSPAEDILSKIAIMRERNKAAEEEIVDAEEVESDEIESAQPDIQSNENS